MGRDDSIDHRQTEARAFAFGLGGLVVKKGSKMRGTRSGGIPWPVSSTSSTRLSGPVQDFHLVRSLHHGREVARQEFHVQLPSHFLRVGPVQDFGFQEEAAFQEGLLEVRGPDHEEPDSPEAKRGEQRHFPQGAPGPRHGFGISVTGPGKDTQSVVAFRLARAISASRQAFACPKLQHGPKPTAIFFD